MLRSIIAPPARLRLCMQCKKPFFHRPKSDALGFDILPLCKACRQKATKPKDKA
ncbi:hypothetical protein [Campylobacter sp. MIT 12-5580]|uniref:hypothetical protein n=1 Tax=Campylobacter sp. MIT 12-5580 TaxID=2040651 RepID=UPI0014859D15|nr:hypothetical protein [Campylobacter sp. MIT 12-5580]